MHCLCNVTLAERNAWLSLAHHALLMHCRSCWFISWHSYVLVSVLSRVAHFLGYLRADWGIGQVNSSEFTRELQFHQSGKQVTSIRKNSLLLDFKS